MVPSTDRRLRHRHPDGQVQRAVLAVHSRRGRGACSPASCSGCRPCAWKGCTGARHLRARRRAAAVAEIQAPRGMDRGVGISLLKPDLALRIPARAQAQPGPLAVPVHAHGGRIDVRARLEPAARPGRSRADRDPRPADRRGHHGDRQRALQIAGVRRQRDVHRRRRRAGAIAVALVAPDSFIFLSISLLVGMVVGGLASITGAVWGAIFIGSCPTSPTRSPRRRRGRSTVR